MIERWSSNREAHLRRPSRRLLSPPRPVEGPQAIRRATRHACLRAAAACQELLTLRPWETEAPVLRDCAMLCGATAELLPQATPLLPRLLASCARSCRAAATACARLPGLRGRACRRACELGAMACERLLPTR